MNFRPAWTSRNFSAAEKLAMWQYLLDGQDDPSEGARLRAFGFGWLFDLDLKNAPHVPAWQIAGVHAHGCCHATVPLWRACVAASATSRPARRDWFTSVPI